MHFALALCVGGIASVAAVRRTFQHREVVIGSNAEEFYRPTIVAQQMVLKHYGIPSRVNNTDNGEPYPLLKDGTMDFVTGFWFGNGNYIDQAWGYEGTGPTADSLVGVGWSYKRAGLRISVPDYVDPSITSLANFTTNKELAKTFKGPIVTFGANTSLDILGRKAINYYGITDANPNITVIAKHPADMYDYINLHYSARDNFFIVGTNPRNFNDKHWKVRTLEDPDQQLGNPESQAAVMWASKTSNIMKTLPEAAADALQRIKITVDENNELARRWMNTGNGVVPYGNNYTKCTEVMEKWLLHTDEGRSKFDEWINGAKVEPDPTDLSFDEFLAEFDLPKDPKREK